MLRSPKFVTTYLKTGIPNQEEQKKIGCNHTSRFVGFPNPRRNRRRIRVLDLSSNEYFTSKCTLTRYPQHAQNANADTKMPKRHRRRYRRFYFYFGTSLLQQKGGGVGSGRTARQGNEINTARRLLKIGFAPVDLLYSESLTKVTKVTKLKFKDCFSTVIC